MIDAKSGVSGAGRAATDKTHFVTVDENVNAYGVPRHRHTPEIEQELAAMGAPITVTFTPHLVPLDQGELVSCYVTMPAGAGARDLEQLYADAYAGEPFVELAATPPGVRDVRETNICRLSVHRDERTGRVIVFGAIDNLWKGAASQAVQNLNLMFGLPRGGGDRVIGEQPFFRSRWMEQPEHVTEAAGGGLPGGFRAAGVACGIKPGGVARPRPAGLLGAADDERRALHALGHARRAGAAEPGALPARRDPGRGRELRQRERGHRPPGLDDAAKMQGAAAIAAGAPESQVAVASTGVIGVPLPIDAVIRGIADARGRLRADGERDFAEAIRTTDAFAKQACLDVELPGGRVRLTAQAKGAGMISPGFATLLCFVQTDAVLSPETCDLLLSVCVKRSFERVSVDGQLSTSDTVIMQCSGASGVQVAPETEAELRFGEALDVLLRQLALMIVRDGEGARRVGRVVVRGGDEQTVHAVARAVGNSSLVKTALYGGDPNWGRIVQAVGAAMPGCAPLAVDIAIEGVQVCSRGAYVPHDAGALVAAVARGEVEYEIGLPGDGAETELYFSDLGHEYVTINAEYTT